MRVWKSEDIFCADILEVKFKMPRPMLKKPQTRTNNILSTTNSVPQMDKLKRNELLRKSRSKVYMEAIQSLDAGGHVHNEKKVKEIINAIQNEFPEIELKGILLGYVATCYLGKPYEVHTLDMTDGIIEHYPSGQPLPNGMEKARGLAMQSSYEFIEVYVDCCRAISAGGMVSVITY